MIRRLLDKHELAAELFLDRRRPADRRRGQWFRQLASDNYVNRARGTRTRANMPTARAAASFALEIIRSARLDAERLDRSSSLKGT
jgi:hypothetical protein